jgi:hypothetical protein
MAALGRVSGPMLLQNLQRLGVDLIIDSNLMYFDVSNRRVGVNVNTPSYTFHANGPSQLSNVLISSNSVTALSGNLQFISNAALGGGRLDFTGGILGNIGIPLANGDATTKKYVDDRIAAVNVYTNFSDGINTANVDIGVQTFYIYGNTNQIYSNVGTSGNVTLSLAPNVTVAGNVTAFGHVGNLWGSINTNTQPYITYIGNQSNLSVAGNATLYSNLQIGNLSLGNNSINSTNANGNIQITPQGLGLMVINSNTAVVLPSGFDSQRPANPGVGMTRYSQSQGYIEVYNGTGWINASGSPPSLTTSDIFTPDGVHNTFTLSQNTTTQGTLVSINGVIQDPSLAYSVTGNQLTMVEVPLTTDIIEARVFGAATTIPSITNGNNNVTVSSPGGSGQITMQLNSTQVAAIVPNNFTINNSLSLSYQLVNLSVATSQTLYANVSSYVIDSTAGATIASATLTLPANAYLTDGQTMTIYSNIAVSSLTLTAGSGTAIKSTPGSLAASGSFARYIFFKIAPGGAQWVRA